MLNKCGVATPTNPLPPVVFAPRNPNVLSIMQQAAQRAQQAFKQPPRLLLVVLPDTGVLLGFWGAAKCVCGWGGGGWVGGCRLLPCDYSCSASWQEWVVLAGWGHCHVRGAAQGPPASRAPDVGSVRGGELG